jgi:hypothetical protein
MLGEGGSGETWLCKDTKSGDEFAIKFIVRPIPKVVLPMIFHEVKVRASGAADGRSRCVVLGRT